MKIEELIREVEEIQKKLVDVDDLSAEYPLYTQIAGKEWRIMIFGMSLVTSEDYVEHLSLEFQIKEEMKDIQKYLSLVLKEGK